MKIYNRLIDFERYSKVNLKVQWGTSTNSIKKEVAGSELVSELVNFKS